jgi:hypothetical protein
LVRAFVEIASKLIRELEEYPTGRKGVAKRKQMCYGIVSCPLCGEWLDEFSASTHECNIPAKKKEELILEKPLELVVAKKKAGR